MKIVAFRHNDIVAHDYGDSLVLFQGEHHSGGVRCVLIDNPKKLHRQLGKFLKRKRNARSS